MRPLRNMILILPASAVDSQDNQPEPLLGVGRSHSKNLRQGTVVAVHKGRQLKGRVVPPCVEVGEVVLFRGDMIVPLKHAGEKHLLVPEVNLLAVLGEVVVAVEEAAS